MGLGYEYQGIAFEFFDEAHGFRSSTNIETALNNELEFYNKTFTL